MNHPIAVGMLLALAALMAFFSALGVMVMRDPFQRMHYPAVAVTFCSLLIIAAVWIYEKDPQARIKVILIGLILYVMNAILTSASAKAVRIRQAGHWQPHPEEQIKIMGRQEVAGAFGATEEHEA